MESTALLHRQKVRRYLDFPPQPPRMLNETDRERVMTHLLYFYDHFGSMDWVTRWFDTLLNVYWRVSGQPAEVAAKMSRSLVDDQQSITSARQFQRLPAGIIKTIPREPSIRTSDEWVYGKPYPPNLQRIKEPNRSFFVILDQTVHEMLEVNDLPTAMIFVAALAAGFAQTYPIQYMVQDRYFKQYVKNEVLGPVIDDDYTYFLSDRMAHTFCFRF